LRNVFTAGLQEGDPNKAKKLELMKIILEENRELRKALGIALSDPNAPDEQSASNPQVETAAKKPVEQTLSDEQLERLVEAISPDATPALSPVLPEVEDETAVLAEEANEKEPVAADSQTTTVEPGPDDEIWEVKPLADTTEGVSSFGIKRLSAAHDFVPPPLERKAQP